MPDMQKTQETKSKILSTIQTRGPSLPTQVSRATSIPPLFVSAFLAELVSDKKLKITNMKVGSSPVYYLQGQESQLENFTEHLNSKEKEALQFLKNSQVLEDQKQSPAIRVALRNLKDFAIPTQVKIDNEIKLFWKQHLTPQAEAKELIQNILTPSNNSKSLPQKPIPQIPSTPSQKESLQLIKVQPDKKTYSDNNLSHPEITEKPINTPPTLPKVSSSNLKESNLNIFEKPLETQTKSIKKPTEYEFQSLIKKHLTTQDIKIVEEISSKKKEYTAKVQHFNQLFGKQSLLLISKDKKKVTENDLALALQKAQTEKMPALIISPGDLDKKAQAYLEEYGNLIKYQKL